MAIHHAQIATRHTGPSRKPAPRLPSALLAASTRISLPGVAGFLLLAAASAGAQETGRLCEVRPTMKCLDKAQIEGKTLKVPGDAVAFQAEGLSICDSSFNFTTSPDIVLIMDNTASMLKREVRDGLPRYCDKENPSPADPECISGDPERLRGPALKAFLDSALVKGGKSMNVGVVTFAEQVLSSSGKLQPFNASTLDSIKASIVMDEMGGTNYSAALQEALNILKTSKKPKSEQVIIFVSDGRPNLPRDSDGGPYYYKSEGSIWNNLPVTHTIFLGANAANYKDMQDIAAHTGGLFFNITDVTKLAGILTQDISRQLFRRAAPTFTTVSNLTTRTVFQLEADRHVPSADSSTYVLKLPGPLQLARGVNELVVKTEYSFGGTTQDVHFKVERSADGPHTGLDQACRAPAALRVLNGSGQPLNVLGLPFLFADTAVRYQLTTAAPLDSVQVEIRVAGAASAQEDRETVTNGAADKTDSTWTGGWPFEHSQAAKQPSDGRVQADHGEYVVVTWRHPYIPEDSVQARVRVKYGPEHDKASYWDLDGDGRIETVRIRWVEALSQAPSRLEFTIVDAAGTHRRAAAGDEIRFAESGGAEDRRAVVVTLADPFPRGVTSVQNADESGRTFRQNDIPLMDGTFRVDDSVPPVIVKAEVRGPDRENELSRVIVTYSEPVTLAEAALEPVVFKRDTVVFDLSQMPVTRAQKLGEREWAFHLQAGAPFSPVGGDSVAINNNGETKDLAGRAPQARTFTGMGGKAPGQSISGFYVTFPNGSRSDARPPADVASPGAGFIPIDSKGYPLPGNTGGKCGSCDPGSEGNFAGPVIHVITKQPVEYELTIYTNLGDAVARMKGRVEETDFALLDRIVPTGSSDPNEVQHVQRIVWTGKADNGRAAGTGAYVVQAVFKYGKNFKTGAKPTTNTRISRFGYIRNCCGSHLKHWYQ